ncbi:unnamed protein product [Oikopleura dioica]|uniref:Uncharacterized protein n=1 Tax=Oikopleura dioica TaxID=34765 RepID=E4Y795_OIKDI|nr:unnamed protein product [Oikopleura dioica]
MDGREYCSRCNKIQNIGSEVANELDDAFHTGNAVQKRHKCVVDTFTKNTQMRHEHPS